MVGPPKPPMLPGLISISTPKVRVERQVPPLLWKQLVVAGLDDIPNTEVWNVDEHSRALAYGTHGVARYFGKFPPPIAGHFLDTYTGVEDRVLDPMCGSGTAVVEGLYKNRDVIALDLNPVAITISRAKTTRVPLGIGEAALERFEAALPRVKAVLPESLNDLRNAAHWFLPETIEGLGQIRRALELVCIDYPQAADVLWASFAAVIRSCSRATSQQGRLFLDIKSAVADPVPVFRKRLLANLTAVSTLPKSANTEPIVADARASMHVNNVAAAIIHPPYFNSYKYSSVYSLEMAWLGIRRKCVAGNEVREGFKQGKKARLDLYLDDITAVLKSSMSAVKRGGPIGLMLGDTVLCGNYVTVARDLIRLAGSIGLKLQTLAIRPPRYTEASWVASQRRTATSLGANMADYFIVFREA